MHVPFSFSRIITSGLLLGMVPSVCTCWFHSMVTFLPWVYYYYYYYYYYMYFVDVTWTYIFLKLFFL
jgi:hypothetical protein